ncbi:MAG: transposase [Nitrospiraceae bacterium]|nr:MAG: transposase [Nitrospiraceae bacterium]
MARPPRIEYPGAFYHVIVRGNQRQAIFKDKKDRFKYLELVERYRRRHGFIIYAYTLMTNHVHLLVETPKTPISRIMQVISFTYTRYFNQRYKKTGHLFQGRYKAYLCDRDIYLLSLVRYIHLNPVRAKLVEKPQEYKWSSHREYLDGNKGVVETDKVLRMFSERPSEARKLYRDFVDVAIGIKSDGSVYKAVGQQIIGDEKFIEKVAEEVDNLDKRVRKPPLKEVFAAVLEETGVSQEEIKSRGRGNAVKSARVIFAGACRESGYRLVELQSELKRDLSVLSRWSKTSENREEGKIVQRVIRKLNA